MQMTSSLKDLELRWEWYHTDETNDAYSELLESIPQSCVDRLTFALMPALEFRILSSRGVFGGLTFLYLRNCAASKYPLQTILDQLHAPSLEILDVEHLTDWRIQWRESFDDTMPNLVGLRLHIKEEDEDVMMFDSGEDYESEEKMVPSNVKWDTVLTLYRRSIFFQMILYHDSSNLFLNHTPSYASPHQLDPVPLVQWLVKSEQFFPAKAGMDHFFLKVSEIPLSDLSTILRSTKLMDFRGSWMRLSLDLLFDTTNSIADLLPDNIVELMIRLPFDGFLDPSVVPECVRSLPKLEYLAIYTDVPGPDFQPRNGCTAATCSFSPLVRGVSVYGVHCKVSRGTDPAWSHGGWLPLEQDIDKHDLGDVDDFEMEIKEWFRLNTSLKLLDICFQIPERNYTMNIS
jgi:hypothetical protein